jgi:hypothetical protein
MTIASAITTMSTINCSIYFNLNNMFKSDYLSIITIIPTSCATIWNHMNQPTVSTYVNISHFDLVPITIADQLLHTIRFTCIPYIFSSSSVGSLLSQCRPTVTGNNISDQPYPSPHSLYSSTSSNYISGSTRVTTFELLLFLTQYFVCAPYNHISVCKKKCGLVYPFQLHICQHKSNHSLVLFLKFIPV